MHRRTVLILLGGITAGIAGCTTPSTPTATPTPSPTPTPTPTPDLRPRWPLTGRLLDDSSLAAHAAIAVKVPDNRNEHPQAGINDADIVFVQLEGYADSQGESATRLAPVFHSTLPERVAPVRSVRPVDVPLFAPMRAVIASTGSSEWVANYAAQFSSSVNTTLTYLKARKQGAYSIDSSRVRTLNGKKYYDRAVVCHPRALADIAPEPFSAGPAQSYLPFATGDDAPSTAGGSPATTVVVPWKSDSDYSMTYTWDAGQGLYLRSEPWGEHVQADGQRVTTDNVLVIRAAQTTEKLAAGSGAADPMHAIIDASGPFHYAHGGTCVEGTWTKGAADSPFSFTLADGSPLAMAPGRTFVELPALDADIRVS